MSSSETTRDAVTTTSEQDSVVPTTTSKEEEEKQWQDAWQRRNKVFWDGMVEIGQVAKEVFRLWKLFQKLRETRKSLLEERGRLNRQMEETDGINHSLLYRMREVSDRLNSCEENLMEVAGRIRLEGDLYVGEGPNQCSVKEFLDFYDHNYGYLQDKWAGVEKILEEVEPFLPDPDLAHEGKDWWGRTETDEDFENYDCSL